MTTPKTQTHKTDKHSGNNLFRKPYEKPIITHREIIEGIAGGCDSEHPVNGKTGVGDNCTMTGS